MKQDTEQKQACCKKYLNDLEGEAYSSVGWCKQDICSIRCDPDPRTTWFQVCRAQLEYRISLTLAIRRVPIPFSRSRNAPFGISWYNIKHVARAQYDCTFGCSEEQRMPVCSGKRTYVQGTSLADWRRFNGPLSQVPGCSKRARSQRASNP
jgi:hypothetical protein